MWDVGCEMWDIAMPPIRHCLVSGIRRLSELGKTIESANVPHT
jgi:hypothetical protein